MLFSKAKNIFSCDMTLVFLRKVLLFMLFIVLSFSFTYHNLAWASELQSTKVLVRNPSLVTPSKFLEAQHFGMNKSKRCNYIMSQEVSFFMMVDFCFEE